MLRISGLHDGRLHKVALPVVTVAPGDDLQTGRGLGVVQPGLDTNEGLQPDTEQTRVSDDIIRTTKTRSGRTKVHLVINHSREEGAEVFHRLRRGEDNRSVINTPD